MRISDIHVDGFGVWSDLDIERLDGGVTLFYGPNEAGKTTLMQFVRAVLYGFTPERRELYLPPVRGGEPGGMLRVFNHQGRFDVVRRISGPDDEQGLGSVSVLGDGGRKQGQHLLNTFLSGVDETVYNNVFAIGIRELQELATLNDTEAAEQLYNLTTGMDRVSLVDVMSELESARLKLLDRRETTSARRDDKRDDKPAKRDAKNARRNDDSSPAGSRSGSRLLSLIHRREKLLDTIEEQQDRSRRWTELATARASLADEVSQLEGKIGRLERESRTVEIAVQLHDKWHAREELFRQLRVLGHVDELPERALDRVAELNRNITTARDQLKPVKQRRMEVRREISAVPVNEPLWSCASRIEAMCEHAPWIASLDGQIERLDQELSSQQSSLSQHNDKLVETGGVEWQNVPPVTQKIVDQLRAPAEAIREASTRRDAARKRQESTHKEADQAKQELAVQLGDRVEPDLDTAIDRSSQLVTQLRRRIQLDDRLDKMVRHRKDLEEEHGELLDDQLKKVRMLLGIGGLFIAGSMLTLTGVFGWKVMPIATEISWSLTLFGLITVALASVWKSVLERSSADQLETCLKRRTSLEGQIDEARHERDELESQLPAGHGPFSQRLTTAEKELKELQTMVPLNVDRQEASKRSQTAQNQVDVAEQELRDARNQWRKALRKYGLPITLTPKHLRQLAAHFQEGSKLRTQLDERKVRLEALRTERQTLTDRVKLIYNDIGLTAVSDDPQVQLSQLSAALAGQRDLVFKRKALKQEESKLRKDELEKAQALRQLMRRRESLFSEARVADEEELHDRAARLDRSKKLQHESNGHGEQIAAVIGGFCPEDEIGRVLVDRDAEDLEKHWEQLVSKLHESQARLAQLHQRRGEMNQEMKTLTEDRGLSAAKFELGCVERQLTESIRRWQVLATTLRLLETVRQVYEAERQPETLGEASEYLRQLTDGKYARIWTPMGNHILRVDEASGESLPLEVLSRGTREAVFLSLRLALIAAYGRRGISLPMVLDDVLVNLDVKRTRAAVQTICRFAQQGHQTMFFTCHDHIRDMFALAGMDVRQLPSRGVPETVIVPEPVVVEPEPIVPEPVIEVVAPVVPEPVVPRVIEVIPEPVLPVAAVIPEPEPAPERRRRRRRRPDVIPLPVVERERVVEPAPEPTVVARTDEEYRLSAAVDVKLPTTLPILEAPEPAPAVDPIVLEFEPAKSERQAFAQQWVEATDELFEDDRFVNSPTWESPQLWWTESETAA